MKRTYMRNRHQCQNKKQIKRDNIYKGVYVLNMNKLVQFKLPPVACLNPSDRT